VTSRTERWRYVDPRYEDHLEMLHDDRRTVPQSARDHALAMLLLYHSRYLQFEAAREGWGRIETRMDIDEMVGMEVL
jgi:hypothetical protein